MYKINQAPDIDRVIDAVVQDGGAAFLVDEADLAVHVFPEGGPDIVHLCEDMIDMYNDAAGEDICSATFSTDDACVHVFFVGKACQIIDRLMTLHLRVLTIQHEEEHVKS